MVKAHDFIRSVQDGGLYLVEEVLESGVKARRPVDYDLVFFKHGDYTLNTMRLQGEEEEVKHNHYFVDLSAYIKDGKCEVDVYTILAAYKVVHPELQHLGKKVLCLGQRGLKDELTDAENILDSAERLVKRLKLEIAYANKGEQCDGQ